MLSIKIKKQSGVILITVLLLGVILFIISVITAFLTIAQRNISFHGDLNSKAQYVADAGVSFTQVYLANVPTSQIAIPSTWDLNNPKFTLQRQIDLPGDLRGEFEVRVWPTIKPLPDDATPHNSRILEYQNEGTGSSKYIRYNYFFNVESKGKIFRDSGTAEMARQIVRAVVWLCRDEDSGEVTGSSRLMYWSISYESAPVQWPPFTLTLPENLYYLENNSKWKTSF